VTSYLRDRETGDGGLRSRGDLVAPRWPQFQGPVRPVLVIVHGIVLEDGEKATRTRARVRAPACGAWLTRAGAGSRQQPRGSQLGRPHHLGADKAAQIHMVITNNTHEALSLVGATDSGTGSHWLAPVTRQPGTSLAGESRSRRGNHRLKTPCSWPPSPPCATPPPKRSTTAGGADGARHQPGGRIASMRCCRLLQHRAAIRAAEVGNQRGSSRWPDLCISAKSVKQRHEGRGIGVLEVERLQGEPARC